MLLRGGRSSRPIDLRWPGLGGELGLKQGVCRRRTKLYGPCAGSIDGRNVSNILDIASVSFTMAVSS